MLFEVEKDFRPTHIHTNLTEPGKASFEKIFFDSDVSDLIIPVDAYTYSMDLLRKVRAKFYEAHGLTGKSDGEIQDYIDRHDLVLPDPCFLPMPTVKKGAVILFEGKASEDYMISLYGMARE